MKVNNVPNYAQGYEFFVAYRIDNELWFWGAWHDRNEANEVALKIGGEVIEN